VIKVNSVYALPFGPQGRWLRQKGVTSYVLGGWQVSGILTMKNGSPFTFTDSVNRTLSGMSYQIARPNLAPGAPPGGIICGVPDQTQDGKPCTTYFSTVQATPGGPFGSFLFPSVLQLGNVGRLTGIAPGIATLDASLQKAFTLTEKVGLQFRADAFNVSNKPSFGLPSATIFGTTGALVGTPGLINSVSVPGRQFQFNLKLIF
jgi:hypothetical protein